MDKKLALRTAKLVSESQKLKSTSNVCIAYEHQPKDPDERRHGILFAVMDLNGHPKQSEELMEIVIDTFHSEYYQSLHKEPLESFENALSKINEELGEFTNNGNTFWMGKLNAILTVYADNTIHITQTGKAESYLYRGGKENHITEDLAGDSVNPLRTFVNITSGELTEGDKISILSSGILSNCSTEEISKFVVKYHPKMAVNHLADLIEGVGGSYGQNAALIVEFLTPDALANEVLDDEPDEIWLQGTTKKEILAEKSGTILQKVFKYLKLAGIVIFEFITETLIPKVQGIFASVKGKSVNIKANKSEKESNVLMDTDEELIDFEKEEIPKLDDDLVDDEKDLEIDGKPLESPAYKSEIHIKESDDSPNKARFEKTKSSILSNLGSLYGSATQLANFKKTKKKLPKIKKNYYLAIGLAVLLIFVPYLFITKIGQSDAKTKKEEKAKYDTMVQKMAEADSLSTQNQKQKAAQDLDEAKNTANELVKGKFYVKEAKGKLTEIDNKINAITQTAEANTSVLSDLSKLMKTNPVGIYSIGNVFYAISDSGEIVKAEKKSKKTLGLQLTGKISGKVVGATALAKIKSIEILTDKPAVYEFNADDNSITEKKASDGWEGAKDVDSYGTNLYLLTDDQIYKHTRTSSGYAKKAPYLANPEDMKGPVSFRIDSDIYVLTSSGEILKFTSGKKQPFGLKDIPVKLNSANFIYTDTETKDILVASKSDKSVVVIGKDGSYLGRYISDNFSSVQYIEIEENTVYVLTNNQILSFNLK